MKKRDIFIDDQDYRVFLSYLKEYLSQDGEQNMPINLAKEIDLLAYCLMPNHYHLFVKQHSADGISRLMKSIGTKYAMYFNRRYDRVGSLFQGPFRAGLVNTDQQFMHLSRYIHLNPRTLKRGYRRFPYSSFMHYAGSEISPIWLNTADTLNRFDSQAEYIDFVAGGISESRAVLDKLALD